MNFNSDYQGLAHHWVYNKDYSYCYGNRMFSNGNVMYSYGHHYIIAQFVKDDVIIFNSDSSSPTTNKQRYAVRSAIPPHITVFRVPEASTNHKANIESYFSRITELLGKASRARANKKFYLLECETLRKELIEYTKAFKTKYRMCKEEKELLTTEVLSVEHMSLIADAKENRRKRKVANDKKLYAASIKKEEERIQEWINGQHQYISTTYNTKVFLRVKDGFVETSKSSRVTIKSAHILYLMIKEGKDIKGHNIDGFTVISLNGTLKIGCHDIPKSEIDRIANLMNWQYARPNNTSHRAYGKKAEPPQRNERSVVI